MSTTASYAKIPKELLDTPNWVVWKRVTRDGKVTKLPYDAKTNKLAASNDPKTWSEFKTAQDAVPWGYDGVGFMLVGTNFVGVDFDGVIDEDSGEIDPFVQNILKQLGNPYSEITPSGSGIRCFVRCAQLNLDKGKKFSNGEHYGVEIYSGADKGRYLTVTGNQAGGSGVPILTHEQIEIPYLLIRQFRNSGFRALWMGDSSAYENDQSRADLALADELVKLVGKDKAKILRYLRHSDLWDEKWEREDYSNNTVDKALAMKLGGDKKHGNESAEPLGPSTGMFRTGDRIKAKRIEWFWKDRVPLGKLTMFAGNPDNGKSLCSTWLAATCTTGVDFPNDTPNHTPPSDVLMLIGEDDIDDTVIPRLQVAGADLKKVHFLEAMKTADGEERDVCLDRDLRTVEQRLESNPNIRLIVIDPISNYLGQKSMVGEQDVRSVLIPLKHIAARYNVAVVIVMHLNKKNDLDAIARVGGAMAFIGVCRASWLFIRNVDEKEEGDAPEPDDVPDSFSMLRIKGNLAKAEKNGLTYTIHAEKLPELNLPGAVDESWTPYVKWGGASKLQNASDALGGSRSKRQDRGRPESKEAKVMTAVRWLAEKLQDGTPKRGTVLIADAKAAEGISEDHLRAAAKEILRVEIAKKGKVWWWTLPHVIATTETVGGVVQTDLIETSK